MAIEYENKNYITELRKIFWPIESYENKKFIPMALMMICIIFNYSTANSIKDALVINHIGVEAISFIKVYLILPLSILMMVIYLRLCDTMSEQKIFYTVISFFLAFYAFFTFILYPNPAIFHPSSSTIDVLVKAYPHSQWFVRIGGSWIYAFFYVITYLWGVMMLSILFWQFANQITTTSEAKRFYPMFALLSSIAPLLLGVSFYYLLNEDTSILKQFIPTQVKLTPALCTLLISGVAIVYLYRWINNNVLTDPRLYNGEQSNAKKKEKIVPSLIHSFKLIFTSKYLVLISMMTIGYQISTSFIGSIWKSKLMKLYPTVGGYTSYIGKLLTYQSFVIIVLMLIGTNIVRRVSWSTAAIITPLLILCIGLVLFSFIMFENTIGLQVATLLGTESLTIISVIGSVHLILGKAAKFSLLDSTKEMAFIPLNNEIKSKGRVAVYILGIIFASSGAIIQTIIFILRPEYTYTEATPFFLIATVVISILWLYSIKKLGKEYQKKLIDNERLHTEG